MNGEHRYLVRVEWTGNTGSGTSDYKSYSRNHLIQEGKPDIPAHRTPRFAATGRAGIRKTCWSGRCRPRHKLWYLHLCAVEGVRVLS